MSTVSLLILNKKKKSGLGLFRKKKKYKYSYFLFLIVYVGIFNLKCLLIECVIPQLGQIYFCIPETGLKRLF